MQEGSCNDSAVRFLPCLLGQPDSNVDLSLQQPNRCCFFAILARPLQRVCKNLAGSEPVLGETAFFSHHADIPPKNMNVLDVLRWCTERSEAVKRVKVLF